MSQPVYQMAFFKRESATTSMVPPNIRPWKYAGTQ